MQRLQTLVPFALVMAIIAVSSAFAAPHAKVCGQVVSIATHDQTTTRYSLATTQGSAQAAPVTVLLLVGGGGNPVLDEHGCATNLLGNSLIRMIPLLHAAGFATALADAPSDHASGEGLAGFRIAAEHADDLGRLVSDLRQRVKGPVWILGTSRGTISAANAAARSQGAAAPDGIVLTSVLMVGDPTARKRWVGQTVFDLPLENIKLPLLAVGHADDGCTRSPAEEMPKLMQRITSARQQAVTVMGGKGARSSGLEACEGKSPHGFWGQEAELVNGIARFIGGGSY